MFRLLIFRPLPKELLRGTVKSVDARAGVCVSLHFMDDVWVPLNLLREGMQWRAGLQGSTASAAAAATSTAATAAPAAQSSTSGYWYWLHEVEGEEAQELSLKPGNSVLIRVAAVVFGEPSELSALGSKPNPKALKPGALAAPASEEPAQLAKRAGKKQQAEAPAATTSSSSAAVAAAAAAAAAAAPLTVAFPGAKPSILAGGEPGDGVHVPVARGVAAAGGVLAQLPPPALQALPSLRAMLGQSGASRGVSALDAILGGEGAGQPPQQAAAASAAAAAAAAAAAGSGGNALGRLFPSASSLASQARKQLGAIVGAGFGGEGGFVTAGEGAAGVGGGGSSSSGSSSSGPGGSSSEASAVGAAGPVSAVSRQALGLGAAGAARGKAAAPLTIYASIAEDGLGNVAWWEAPVAEEEGAAGVVEEAPPSKRTRTG